MRIVVGLVALGTLALSPAARASAPAVDVGTLNLVCTGKAEDTEIAVDQYVVSQDSDVRLYLTGDGGTAEIPRLIGGGKEGRRVVRLFTATASLITGKINYRDYGNAKMQIDRIAGTVAIKGPEGNFSGRCRPLDPAEMVPKF